MKRFTDTALWDKSWFRKLSPAHKCAFFFIKDRCDNAGVWAPDFEAAEFFIGGPVNWDEFRKECNGNIKVIYDNGKWLVDFPAQQ